MRALLLTRTTLIWSLLVGATLLSWELGHGVGLHGTSLAGAAILVVTFIKARFVVLDFMELRHAPRALRIVFEGWTVLACVLLVTLFVRGTP